MEGGLLVLEHLGLRHLFLRRLDVEALAFRDKSRSIACTEEVLAAAGGVPLIYDGGPLLDVLARIWANFLRLLEENQGVGTRVVLLHDRSYA